MSVITEIAFSWLPFFSDMDINISKILFKKRRIFLRNPQRFFAFNKSLLFNLKYQLPVSATIKYLPSFHEILSQFLKAIFVECNKIPVKSNP